MFEGAEDLYGDEIDTSCDQVDGQDQDRDGHLAQQTGGDDCDDQNATVFPGANDNQGLVAEPVHMAAIGRIGIALSPVGAPFLASSGYGPELPDCPAGGKLGFDTYESALGYRTSGTWLAQHLESWCGVFGGLNGPAAVSAGPHGFVHVVTGEENLVYFGGLPGVLEERARLIASGYTPVLAVDRCGRVHVASYSMYTVVDAPQWWTDPTLIGSDNSSSPAIAVDDQDVVHLAYVLWREAGGGYATSVAYLTVVDGVWSDEHDIPGTDDVSGVALSLDRSGAPVIAAHGGGRVLVASREDGNWSVELVDAEASQDAPAPSLAVDSEGTRHVVYSTGRGLEYAEDENGDWDVRSLTSDGHDPSAVVDSAGGLHVAYFSEQGPTYATYREGLDGVDQNCDGVDGVDADGDAHASRETGGDDTDDLDPRVN